MNMKKNQPEDQIIIDSFNGQYEFLSNFVYSPIVFLGKTWSTVEHLYQALKTSDKSERNTIKQCITPEEAKRIGKNIKTPPDWEHIKKDIMLKCVRLKFRQNANLADKLQKTRGSYFIGRK
jgi:ribA/ribD-fused uncharacterized protein